MVPICCGAPRRRRVTEQRQREGETVHRTSHCRRTSLLLSAVALLVLASKSFAQLQPGDILVYDTGELRAVRPDGTRVAGFEVPIPDQMFGLATGPGGAIYLTAGPLTGNVSALYRVNPQTGALTTVATAPPLDSFKGVAVEPTGSLVVSTEGKEILRIDPATGARTTIVPADGGFLSAPNFVRVGPGGDIYTSSQNAQGSFYIARVNPVTGAQTTVTSDQFFAALKGFDVAPDGTIFAANISHALPAPGEEQGQILRIDPATGQQTVLYTSNTNPNEVFNPLGITLDPSGNVLVADIQSPTSSFIDGAVFRFDPVTGARTLVYAGGLDERDPEYVAVFVPEPASVTLCLIAGVGVLLCRPRRPHDLAA
jgi:sugar lactone lactonase YvrE